VVLLLSSASLQGHTLSFLYRARAMQITARSIQSRLLARRNVEELMKLDFTYSLGGHSVHPNLQKELEDWFDEVLIEIKVIMSHLCWKN